MIDWDSDADLYTLAARAHARRAWSGTDSPADILRLAHAVYALAQPPVPEPDTKPPAPNYNHTGLV